jgi:hypothetical protein
VCECVCVCVGGGGAPGFKRGQTITTRLTRTTHHNQHSMKLAWDMDPQSEQVT